MSEQLQGFVINLELGLSLRDSFPLWGNSRSILWSSLRGLGILVLFTIHDVLWVILRLHIENALNFLIA